MRLCVFSAKGLLRPRRCRWLISSRRIGALTRPVEVEVRIQCLVVGAPRCLPAPPAALSGVVRAPPTWVCRPDVGGAGLGGQPGTDAPAPSRGPGGSTEASPDHHIGVGGEVVVDVVSAGDLGKSTVSGTYVLNQNAKRRDHMLPLVALDGAATKTAPTTSGDVASSRLAGVKI